MLVLLLYSLVRRSLPFLDQYLYLLLQLNLLSIPIITRNRAQTECTLNPAPIRGGPNRMEYYSSFPVIVVGKIMAL